VPTSPACRGAQSTSAAAPANWLLWFGVRTVAGAVGGCPARRSPVLHMDGVGATDGRKPVRDHARAIVGSGHRLLDQHLVQK
jgi:hypothetical protein